MRKMRPGLQPRSKRLRRGRSRQDHQAKSLLSCPAFYLEQMAHHDCHTQQILSTEDDNKSKNNHATYQCCVGVIANSSTYQQFQESFLSQLVPRVSELPIDAMPEHIFKPPKKMG